MWSLYSRRQLVTGVGARHRCSAVVGRCRGAWPAVVGPVDCRPSAAARTRASAPTRRRLLFRRPSRRRRWGRRQVRATRAAERWRPCEIDAPTGQRWTRRTASSRPTSWNERTGLRRRHASKYASATIIGKLAISGLPGAGCHLPASALDGLGVSTAWEVRLYTEQILKINVNPYLPRVPKCEQ